MPNSSATLWKEPQDEKKPTELVQAAEYAIILRLQELDNSSDDHEERVETRSLTAMTETHEERCGKCEAEIDPNRRVDFTLKDGTRVCEQCFIRGNARVASEIDRFYLH